MELRGINFVETRLGSLWCMGEVYNPGTTPLSELQVGVALYDKDANELAHESAFTLLDVLPPGGSVPFAVLFADPPAHFAQYQVVPIAGVPASEKARYHMQLTPFEVEGEPEGTTSYKLRGKLQNDGDSDAESIRLVATAYDDEGRVIAVRAVDLPVTVLRRGATTTFEASLTLSRSSVAAYTIQAQGLRVE